MNKQHYNPGIAIPPVEILKDMMKRAEMSVEEFQKQMGWPKFFIEQILNGKYPLRMFKYDLAKVFKTSQAFWVNLEHNYKKTLRRLEKNARSR